MSGTRERIGYTSSGSSESCIPQSSQSRPKRGRRSEFPNAGSIGDVHDSCDKKYERSKRHQYNQEP